MIKSMTGYGIASFDSGNTKYTVEIKSLNSKFLELSLRLPKIFSEKEFQLRTECNKQIERGKVNLSINVEQASTAAKAAGIDTALLKNYFEQLKAVSAELDEPTGNLLQLALGLPEVVKYDDETLSEDEWKVVEKTFNQAMAAFQQCHQPRDLRGKDIEALPWRTATGTGTPQNDRQNPPGGFL